MGQVSLPIRIVLVGALAFLALWMVALKPKAAAEEPVAAPAPAAAAVTPAEPAPAEPAAPARPATPEPDPEATTAAKPKPAPKPEPVTVIALVGTGVDDAVARELVAELDGARTRVIPIEEIGRHKDLVGSVEIRQTPTILVIGADRKAQRIEGLPDAAQLDRALAAAR